MKYKIVTTGEEFEVSILFKDTSKLIVDNFLREEEAVRCFAKRVGVEFKFNRFSDVVWINPRAKTIGLFEVVPYRRGTVSYTYQNKPFTPQGEVFEFKVKDYTTLMIGRMHLDEDFYECYAYVQRGDGTRYKYYLDRLTFLREIP